MVRRFMKLIPIFAALTLALQLPQVVGQSLSVQKQVDLYGEPLIVLNAEKAWLRGGAFWPLAKSGDPLTQRYAIRAIGRLEDPANVPALLALGKAPHNPFLTAPIGEAIVQSLYRYDPERDPDLISAVHGWFLEIALVEQPGAPPPTP